MRSQINLSSERTLIHAIIPPGIGHIHSIIGLYPRQHLVILSACMASIVIDFLVKIQGNKNINNNMHKFIPLLTNSVFKLSLKIRTLLLNCLTNYYNDLWIKEWDNVFITDGWSKSDPRLSPARFSGLKPAWTWGTPLRTDYERRQALVEIDVLTALAMGFDLEQLKTIYRVQFSVLQKFEKDTWYDSRGRIVFTNNQTLCVGLSRKEWESVKNMPTGVVTQEIEDDTQPGGPVRRTVEYVAPFDRCDRERDYETAWAFFSKKNHP